MSNIWIRIDLYMLTGYLDLHEKSKTYLGGVSLTTNFAACLIYSGERLIIGSLSGIPYWSGMISEKYPFQLTCDKVDVD